VSAFQNHHRQAQPRAVRCCRGRLPERRLLQDYDAVMDKAAEAEELSADHRSSTLEKLAELASDTSAPKSSARSAPEL